MRVASVALAGVPVQLAGREVRLGFEQCVYGGGESIGVVQMFSRIGEVGRVCEASCSCYVGGVQGVLKFADAGLGSLGAVPVPGCFFPQFLHNCTRKTVSTTLGGNCIARFCARNGILRDVLSFFDLRHGFGGFVA